MGTLGGLSIRQAGARMCSILEWATVGKAMPTRWIRQRSGECATARRSTKQISASREGSLESFRGSWEYHERWRGKRLTFEKG